MSQRRLLKLNKGTSLGHRLADEANRLRAAADRAKDFQERLRLLREARHADTAAHLNEWVSSPGLQPPR